jgi:hypothetical protein
MEWDKGQLLIPSEWKRPSSKLSVEPAVSFSSRQAGASSPKPSPESGRKVTSPKTEGPTLSPFLTRSPALGVNLDLPKEEEASSKIIISDVRVFAKRPISSSRFPSLLNPFSRDTLSHLSNYIHSVQVPIIIHGFFCHAIKMVQLLPDNLIDNVAHELAGLRYLSGTLMMQILSCWYRLVVWYTSIICCIPSFIKLFLRSDL